MLQSRPKHKATETMNATKYFSYKISISMPSILKINKRTFQSSQFIKKSIKRMRSNEFLHDFETMTFCSKFGFHVRCIIKLVFSWLSGSYLKGSKECHRLTQSLQLFRDIFSLWVRCNDCLDRILLNISFHWSFTTCEYNSFRRSEFYQNDFLCLE